MLDDNVIKTLCDNCRHGCLTKLHLAGHQDVIMLRLSTSLTGVALDPLNKAGGLKHKTDFLSNVPDISFARLRELQIVISLKTYEAITSVGCSIL